MAGGDRRRDRATPADPAAWAARGVDETIEGRPHLFLRLAPGRGEQLLDGRLRRLAGFEEAARSRRTRSSRGCSAK